MKTANKQEKGLSRDFQPTDSMADPGWGIWSKCPPPPLQEIAYKIEIL